MYHFSMASSLNTSAVYEEKKNSVNVVQEDRQTLHSKCLNYAVVKDKKRLTDAWWEVLLVALVTQTLKK